MASYPPPGQVLSALGIEVARREPDGLVGRALVDPALLGRGAVPAGMGALAPIVDLVAGSRAARATEGYWLATSDLWMHERSPIVSGPIELETQLLRAGRRSVVVAVEVTAGGDPWVASTVEFATIRREATGHSTGVADADGGWSRLGSGPLLDSPIEDACRLTIVDPAAGTAELARSPFVNNSIGTFQGGMMVLLADAAAASRFGPGARVSDMQFRFLAQTGDGPARAQAAVIRSEGRRATLGVELTDRSDGTLVGWAVCTVRLAEGR